MLIKNDKCIDVLIYLSRQAFDSQGYLPRICRYPFAQCRGGHKAHKSAGLKCHARELNQRPWHCVANVISHWIHCIQGTQIKNLILETFMRIAVGDSALLLSLTPNKTKNNIKWNIWKGNATMKTQGNASPHHMAGERRTGPTQQTKSKRF